MRITLIMIAIFALFGSFGSYANDMTGPCDYLAKKAAALAEVGGRRDLLQNMTATALLVKKSKSQLFYQVNVFEQYSDGSSTVEFPQSIYHVIAAGNESKCQITGVKKQ